MRTLTSTPLAASKISRRGPRRWRLSLRDARFRSRLGLVLLIPVVALGSLAGAGLAGSYHRVSSARQVRALAGLSADVATLTHDLQHERMAAAAVLTKPRLRVTTTPGTSNQPQVTPLSDAMSHAQDVAAFEAATEETDRAISAYTARRQGIGDLPRSITTRLNAADANLTTITTVRAAATAGQGRVRLPQAILRYSVIIDSLVAFHAEISSLAEDETLATGLRALDAFEQAKAYMAEAQALAFAALSNGSMQVDDIRTFVAAHTAAEDALATFSRYATAPQRDLVAATVTGQAVQLASSETALLSQQRASEEPHFVGSIFGALVDLMRYAAQQMQAQLAGSADQLAGAAVRRGTEEGIALLVALALTILIAVSVTRSTGPGSAQPAGDALAAAPA